ncbi:MAG: sigma-70 family RNA polymerase sigma factor [Clostridia bacterium]|nr:sigma-70 family RNA polymerase sigma factor [Clostridia bacterium]
MYYNKVEICGVNTARLPTLTSLEKKNLLRRTKDGDMAAREELIDGNLRLVLSIIQRFTNRRESMDDLFQVGCIGLIKAVDNFNPELEVEFSTYAVPTVIESRKHTGGNMTRKQALEAAAERLGKSGENGEVIAVLYEIMHELPLASWTDGRIRDAVEQFIAENGYIPSVRDFGKRPLPPHTVIRNRYGITCGEWMKRNYPKTDISPESETKRLTAAFLEDYRRIKPRSAREFDRNRSPSTPCWITVCRHHGLTRWRQLLAHLGLEPGKNAGKTGETAHLRVKIRSDCDFPAGD